MCDHKVCIHCTERKRERERWGECVGVWVFFGARVCTACVHISCRMFSAHCGWRRVGVGPLGLLLTAGRRCAQMSSVDTRSTNKNTPATVRRCMVLHRGSVKGLTGDIPKKRPCERNALHGLTPRVSHETCPQSTPDAPLCSRQGYRVRTKGV